MPATFKPEKAPPGARVAIGAPRAARIAGIVLAVVGLTFYYLMVLRVPLDGTWRLDVGPSPDGEEYLAGALSLAGSGTYTIEVAGHRVPPRFPFGFSLLLVPGILLDQTPECVPFVVNAGLGLAILAAVFGAVWRSGRPVGAGLALVLIATWPAFVILCRSPLSDIANGGLFLVVCWGLVKFVDEGRARAGIASACLLGVMTWFKMANVFLTPLLVIAPLVARAPWRTRIRMTVALCCAGLAGAMPLLVYNLLTFGSPLRTGYSLWMPSWVAPEHAFSFANLRINAGMVWRDVFGFHGRYATAGMYGLGSYLSLGLLALIAVAVIARLRRRSEIAVATMLVGNAAAFQFMKFQDLRLIFAPMLVAVVFAASETGPWLTHAWREKRTFLATGLTTLIALSVIGFCERAPGLEIAALLDYSMFGRPAPHRTLVAELDKRANAGAALIFSDFNPVYISALLKADPTVIPLNPIFLPERDQLGWNTDHARRALQDAADARRPVYLLSGDHPIADTEALFPAPDRWKWRTIYKMNDTTAMAMLIQP